MLTHIKQTAKDIVMAIGSVMDAYIAICDDKGNFIAVDNNYVEKKGTRAHKPFIKKVIHKGVPTIIHKPGNHDYCKGCDNEHNCPETLEIVYPFYYQNRAIGYISIISFSSSQATDFVNKKVHYLAFLEQMGNLIVGAVAEHLIQEKLLLTSSELTSTINAIDRGVITCGENGIILHCNQIVCDMLSKNMDTLIGTSIKKVLTKCKIVNDLFEKKQNQNNEIEWQPLNASPRHRFLISGRCMQDESNIFLGAVFTLQKLTDAHRFIQHNFTSAIDFSLDDIIGISSATLRLKKNIRSIARSQSTIIIRGETGTGKELVARTIHALSPRNQKPFVAINCAAIPDSLLESELFGYESGAFTGATKTGKAGKFEFANGGTVFLDEIGDMPLHLQAKLLRVLQDKAIERIGSNKQIPLNIRIIAATHQNLEKKILQKEFREDLFYRLSVIPLLIEPLRERKDDILPIATHFIKKLSPFNAEQSFSLSASFINFINHYDWPGNVRELQNAIEYAINIEETNQLTEDSLPPRITKPQKQAINLCPKSTTLDEQIIALERKIITNRLDELDTTSASINQIANDLGVSRATLYRKIKRAGIQIN